MTGEEQDILTYLKASPRTYFSTREIARRAAGKKTFEDTPEWARVVIPRLVEKGVLEMDGAGHVRLKNRAEDIRSNGRKWVSPRIARLLEKGQKDFKDVATLEIQEEES